MVLDKYPFHSTMPSVRFFNQILKDLGTWYPHMYSSDPCEYVKAVCKLLEHT